MAIIPYYYRNRFETPLSFATIFDWFSDIPLPITYKVIANSHLILSTSIHQCYRHLHIYNNNLIILLPQIFGLILHLINFSSLTSLASELRAGLQHTSLPLKVVQPFLPLGITVFPSWPHFLDFVHRSFPMPPSRPSSTTSAIKSVLFQLVCFGPS